MRQSLPSKTRAVCLLLTALGFALSGCQLVERTARIPVEAVGTVVPVAKSGQPDPAALQAELQRYADEFAARTVAAIEDYARIAGTPAAQSRALEWKVSVSSAAVSIASGPNPTANLLDFLSLATITRIALEEDWSKSAEGQAFQPWLETGRSLEKEAWQLAEGVFSADQQQELRNGIRNWWQSNSRARAAFFVRPQEFSSLIRQTGQQHARPESVFALVGLDPTAGLDPAVREVTRARLFAERALFTAQRMPFLLRWQIELLGEQLLQGAEASTALTNMTRLTENADRMSHAVESLSQTAALLPDRFSAERKAILEALEQQEGKLRDLSAEVNRTLASGEKMSASLNTTLTTFGALMKRFGVGEPVSGPPATNSPPFSILDYAKTAEQIAAMAQQLDVLIKDASSTLDSPALDQRIREFNTVSRQAKADAKSVLNHAFVLAAGLVLLAFGCGVVYRHLGRASPRSS